MAKATTKNAAAEQQAQAEETVNTTTANAAAEEAATEETTARQYQRVERGVDLSAMFGDGRGRVSVCSYH